MDLTGLKFLLETLGETMFANIFQILQTAYILAHAPANYKAITSQ